MVGILHDLYIYIYQQYRKSGSIVQISVVKVMQGFYHQQ